jgi:hypothetical protein
MDTPANAEKIDLGMVYPCGCSEKEPQIVKSLIHDTDKQPILRAVCLRHGKYCDVPLEKME